MSAVFHLDPGNDRMSVGSSNSIQFTGKVFGADTRTEAISAVLADTDDLPSTLSITADTGYGSAIFSFVRSAVNVTQIIDGNSPPTTWAASISYDAVGYSNQPYQVGDESTTFEIGRDMINRKHAISISAADRDTQKYPHLGSTPDVNGLINISPSGEVEGVDVPQPTFKWTETHYMDDATVTTALVAAWYAVSYNPINDDTFRDYAAGEAQFLGVTGCRRHRGGDWELNFSFAASPNETGLTVGTITGIAKKGWQYLWPWLEMSTTLAPDGTTKITMPVVKYVYVQDVIGKSAAGSDFSTLGIGTT